MERKKRSAIWKLPKSKLQRVVSKSDTLAKILKHFGLVNKGGNCRTLKNRLNADNIDYSHIPLGRDSNRNRPKGGKQYPLKEILVRNSFYINRVSLRKRLLDEKLLVEQCYNCGLGPEWDGEPLRLQLHHVNGDGRDHRISNIRLLCPNCHSQTDSFAGRKNGYIRE